MGDENLNGELKLVPSTKFLKDSTLFEDTRSPGSSAVGATALYKNRESRRSRVRIPLGAPFKPTEKRSFIRLKVEVLSLSFSLVVF